MPQSVSNEVVAEIAAKVASEVVKQQDTSSTMLWMFVIVITVLWGIVVYFVKRHIDKTDERLQNHTTNHADLGTKVEKVELQMQATATKKDISETYGWVDNKLRELKENDINPLRTELTNAINTLRLEIKQDLNTIISLIKANKNDS